MTGGMGIVVLSFQSYDLAASLSPFFGLGTSKEFQISSMNISKTIDSGEKYQNY
jgi:hypothetical protein